MSVELPQWHRRDKAERLLKSTNKTNRQTYEVKIDYFFFDLLFIIIVIIINILQAEALRNESVKKDYGEKLLKTDKKTLPNT